MPAEMTGLPSLFDIQVNGFAGVDFQREGLGIDAIRTAVFALREHATDVFFPTLITAPISRIVAQLECFERACDEDAAIAAAIRGYHIEGPWLSPFPGYRGAHNARWMGSPDLRDYERMQHAARGRIRLITLAPELPGSEALILRAVSEGVRISLGHTAARESDIVRAIAAGARFCTHLGNGVPLELHRHDNVMQRLLAHDELTAFLIPDGIHLPPHTLKNFFRAKPAGKALFTTDCMSAAAAPPGRYSLGDLEMEVGQDRIVRMPGGKAFAGSALSPDEGVVNATKFLGISTAEARSLFSTRIAEAFGIQLPKH